MNPWLQKHIDNKFRDFEGLSITGQIPVKDQLLNELLAELLKQAQGPAEPASTSEKPDLRPVLQLVKRAEVRAVNGAIVVDFQIGV